MRDRWLILGRESSLAVDAQRPGPLQGRGRALEFRSAPSGGMTLDRHGVGDGLENTLQIQNGDGRHDQTGHDRGNQCVFDGGCTGSISTKLVNMKVNDCENSLAPLSVERSTECFR